MKQGFTNKRCPKCGGNIYLDMDYLIEGSLLSWYEQERCLQCSYISYERNMSLTKITANSVGVEKETLPV